jgi:transcription initiation factor TFIIB
MEVARAWADFDLLRHREETFEFCTQAEYLCSSCGEPKVFDGVDLPTCIGCGRVDADFISDEPEWNFGGDPDSGKADPTRCGAPVNTEHFSEAWGQTTFMTTQRGASYATRRLARIHQHTSMNHRDRALFHAYAEMDRIGKGVLGLPDAVMFSAKTKYRTFNEAVLTRGAVRNGVKANCIFQACREFGIGRTTQAIADAFGIPARDVSRTFNMYQEQVPETSIHVTTPADLVPQFFNDITCVPAAEKGRVKMKVVKLCKGLENCVELMGRTPKAVACAVMFIVLSDGKYDIKKADVCKICAVSVPTLAKLETLIREQLKDSTPV